MTCGSNGLKRPRPAERAPTMTRQCTAALLLAFGLWCPPLYSAHSGASTKAAATRLVATGSTTMAPLVTEMVQRFEALYPGVKIEVRSGGSGKGISERN